MLWADRPRQAVPLQLIPALKTRFAPETDEKGGEAPPFLIDLSG
jgi:hypothetical protein